MTSASSTTTQAQDLAQSSMERLRDRVLVLLFAIGLAFPLVAQMADWGASQSGTEKRILAEFPSLAPDEELRAAVVAEGGGNLEAWRQAVDRWPGLYQTWFDDHFAFRAELIRLHHRGYVQGIGVSPRADVVIGKQGWLFTNGSDGGQAALDQVRGIFPFSEAQLREWQRFLEEIRDWFRDRGVPYYVTFAPAKPTIHPEFLPPGLAGEEALTRLDQLHAWLADTPRREGFVSVPLIDLRPDLLAAKETMGVLYRRTDTHWNAAGALTASATVVDRLRADGLGPDRIVPTDFVLKRAPDGGGDLAAKLELADLLEDERVSCRTADEIEFTRQVEGLVPVRIPGTAIGQEENLAEERQKAFRFVQERDDLPRLLMFRDSAASAMVPFLARAFSSSSYYWQYRIHNPSIMARERPDVVLQEIGERILMRNVGMPINERFIVEDLERRRAFGASTLSLDLVSSTGDSAQQQALTSLTLSLADLPTGQAVLVRVAGDFEQGGRVRIQLRSKDQQAGGQTLLDKDLIPWRDVVYARVEAPRADQVLAIEIEAAVAREVLAEVRAVKPREAPAQGH